MRKKNNDFAISRMFCCNCGKEGVPIGRKAGHYREAGHLKKLYCIYCGKEWNHAEVRSMHSDYNYDDFKLEMKYNNFDENGNRKIPYRIFRGNLKKEGVI